MQWHSRRTLVWCTIWHWFTSKWMHCFHFFSIQLSSHNGQHYLCSHKTIITDTCIQFMWIWTAMSILLFIVNWLRGNWNRKAVKNALQTLYRTHRCWMRNVMLNIKMGVYDYRKCQVTDCCSILHVGEDNTELQPKSGANFRLALHRCIGFWRLVLSKRGG